MLREPITGVDTLCRVKSVKEGRNGQLEIEAWEWPLGVATAIDLTPQSSEGWTEPTGQFDDGLVAALAAQETADGAATDAAAAQATADGAVSDAAAAQADASSALTLAGSKAAVFYQASPPTNPQGGYTLKVGDLWFNTDTTTNCPDTSCKGHTADSNGAPQVGTYPHRGIYWVHRWDGSAWKDAGPQALLIASEIAAGAITADKIAAGAITAEQISAGQITARQLVSAYGDNLWPNGHSEVSPPAGYSYSAADTEFGRRLYGGAYAGNYCRQFFSVSNSEEDLSTSVPVQGGDVLSLRAMVKLNAAATSPEATLEIAVFDGSGTTVYQEPFTSPTGAWTPVRLDVTASASAYAAVLRVFAKQSGGTLIEAARVDNIVAQRLVTSSQLASGVVKAQHSTPLASDVTTTSGTYADVTGLSFSVEASGVYEFEFVLPAAVVSDSGALAVRLTGPSSPTSLRATYESVVEPIAGGNPTLWPASANAFGAEMYVSDWSNYRNLQGAAIYRVRGILRNGANAGTVQLQWRRYAAGTPTIYAGAFVRWAKLN